jgi:hypothetical protein
MNKDFDAVDLVRKIRDDLYDQTKDMSAAELIAFFERQGSSARQKVRQVHEKRREALARGSE